MLKRAIVSTLVLAGLALAAAPAEARHIRRHHHHHHLSMHGWCRADVAQMMGVRRAAVFLAPQVERTSEGWLALRGIADHGFYGQRSFTCVFNARGVFQGAV